MPGMTDRDHFAAAALTGLLAQGDDGSFSEDSYARAAYRWADAMLRERSRSGKNSSGGTDSAAKCTDRDSANHDAAPAARASVESVAPQPTTRGDSDRADKAAPRPSDGTGDTPATHATHVEGSERRECTEPVAWAVACDYGDYGVALFSDEASAQTEADRRALVGLRPGYVVVPLYRSPTLTDAEAETLRELRDEAAQYADEIGLCASEVRGRQRIIDGLLVRLGGER